jgi:hypothetical protein
MSLSHTTLAVPYNFHHNEMSVEKEYSNPTTEQYINYVPFHIPSPPTTPDREELQSNGYAKHYNDSINTFFYNKEAPEREAGPYRSLELGPSILEHPLPFQSILPPFNSPPAPHEWTIVQSPSPVQSFSIVELLQDVAVELDSRGIPLYSNEAKGGKTVGVVKKIKRASGQGNYQCLECNSVFSSRKNLNSHAIRHTSMFFVILTLPRRQTLPVRYLFGLVEEKGRSSETRAYCARSIK